MRMRSGSPHLPKGSSRGTKACKCENGHEFSGMEAKLNGYKCPECQTGNWKVVRVI